MAGVFPVRHRHRPRRGPSRASGHVGDFQQVTTDYQATARAAHQGNRTVFRSDFDRVAPRGCPAGPDRPALDHARPLPDDA